MNKEQIEEMAIDVMNTGLPLELAGAVAIDLYNAGYRKETLGDWLYDFTLDDRNFYKCSVCGRKEVLLAKESPYEYFPYCHCGAKMKGE